MDESRDRKISDLEDRLRTIEGAKHLGPVLPTEICLVPDLVVSKDFRVPDFEKYNGTSCPRAHLVKYVHKMAEVAHDDKLLIHFFQDSLIGASADWYGRQNKETVKTWKDLAEAFLDQYSFNIAQAPDRTDLRNMEKKNSETFKEYAQRWRVLASQIHPPLSEKEMASFFIDTLKPPYLGFFGGSATTPFR